MKEVGQIIEFDAEGRAIVEFERKSQNCSGCASCQICVQNGQKKRLVLEVIPGVALGSRVYVDIGRRSLLRWPVLAYVMIGTFIGGALAGEILFSVFRARQPGMLSIMLGLVATAACIIALNVDEHRRSKEGFTPRIVGVMWRAAR